MKQKIEMTDNDIWAAIYYYLESQKNKKVIGEKKCSILNGAILNLEVEDIDPNAYRPTAEDYYNK